MFLTDHLIKIIQEICRESSYVLQEPFQSLPKTWMIEPNVYFVSNRDISISLDVTTFLLIQIISHVTLLTFRVSQKKCIILLHVLYVQRQSVVYSIWFYCALHEEKLYRMYDMGWETASTALLGDSTQHVPEHFCV